MKIKAKHNIIWSHAYASKQVRVRDSKASASPTTQLLQVTFVQVYGIGSRVREETTGVVEWEDL